MTQYNALNKKLSNSQFNNLKSGIKNGTEVTHKMLLVILMMRIIFRINCYKLMHKFQIIPQLTSNCQKLTCIKYDNQEDF